MMAENPEFAWGKEDEALGVSTKFSTNVQSQGNVAYVKFLLLIRLHHNPLI